MDYPMYNGVFKIYSVNTDGSNLQMLSSGAEFALSKTGDSIYFMNDGGLYYINGDGTNNRLMIPPSSLKGYGSFGFSVDGSKICCRQSFVNRDGTGLTNISIPDSMQAVDCWLLMPDNRIVFGYKCGLFSMETNGSNLKVIKAPNTSPYRPYNLQYIPQENSIVYLLDEYTGRTLNLYNLNTSTNTVLYTGNITFYSVSPQSTIAFSVDYILKILDLNTKTISQITTGSFESFSNDGTKIVYLIPDSSGIYMYNLQTSSTDHIKVNMPGNTFFNPRLSYDNSKIFFVADSSYIVK